LIPTPIPGKKAYWNGSLFLMPRVRFAQFCGKILVMARLPQTLFEAGWRAFWRPMVPVIVLSVALTLAAGLGLRAVWTNAL